MSSIEVIRAGRDKNMMYRLFSLGASISITATGLFLMESPASAQSRIVVSAPGDVVTRGVSYADLDLTGAPGERTLNARGAAAVRSLCSEVTDAYDGTNDANNSMKRCQESAWEQLRPQTKRAARLARDNAAVSSPPVVETAITSALPK